MTKTDVETTPTDANDRTLTRAYTDEDSTGFGEGCPEPGVPRGEVCLGYR